MKMRMLIVGLLLMKMNVGAMGPKCDFYYFKAKSESKSYVFVLTIKASSKTTMPIDKIVIDPKNVMYAVKSQPGAESQIPCTKEGNSYVCRPLFGPTQENVAKTVAKREVNPENPEELQQVFVTDPKTGKKTRPIFLPVQFYGFKEITLALCKGLPFGLHIDVYKYDPENNAYDKTPLKSYDYDITPLEHSMNLTLDYNKITGISFKLKGGEYKKK